MGNQRDLGLRQRPLQVIAGNSVLVAGDTIHDLQTFLLHLQYWG
jgi:hypothetical protein